MTFSANLGTKTARPSTSMSMPPMGGMESTGSGRRRGRIGRMIVGLLLVIVVIGGACWAMRMGGMPWSRGMVDVRANWQAVFLTNGQVYFGKVVHTSRKTVVLKNIYYLQVVNQPLQRSAEGEQPPADQQQTEQRLTLIKLGNEIHGPQDQMTINWDQVVLVEDLKEDGRVVQAINDYISKQK